VLPSDVLYQEGREGEGREGKGREGKEREGKGRKGEGRESAPPTFTGATPLSTSWRRPCL